MTPLPLNYVKGKFNEVINQDSRAYIKLLTILLTCFIKRNVYTIIHPDLASFGKIDKQEVRV